MLSMQGIISKMFFSIHYEVNLEKFNETLYFYKYHQNKILMSYNIRTREEYTRSYQNSVEKNTEFWEGIAKEFTWFKPWNTVMNCDMKEASFKWFEGAKTNITFNSIDRHLERKSEQTAIIFEPNMPNEQATHISYSVLHKKVCKMANLLSEMGINKGDRVAIYLPMIPELAVSVLFLIVRCRVNLWRFK